MVNDMTNDNITTIELSGLKVKLYNGLVLAYDQELPCDNPIMLIELLKYVPPTWKIVTANQEEHVGDDDYNIECAVGMIGVNTLWHGALTIDFNF